MPSLDPQIRRIIALSVGILLLVATVLAPFGAIAWTYEYEVAPVTADDPQLASELMWPDKTATCTPDNDACAVAYRVRNDGSRVVSDATYRAAHGFSADTRLVIFTDGTPVFFQPNTTRYENDSTRIALEPVSNATALDLASTPADRFPSGVQRLVAEKHIRTSHPLTGMALWDHTDAVVAHDGTYYRQDGSAYRGPMQGVPDFLRLAVLAIGAVLCYHAGRIE